MTLPRPTRLASAALLVGTLLAGTCAPPRLAGAGEPGWRPGPRGDLVFETSDFLRATNYSRLNAAADKVDPDGAFGPVNRSWNASRRGRWLIGEQRGGFDVVAAGLSYDRQDLVAQGERVLNWGFARQRPDGSFDCADPWHGTALFVEAAAHAALLLQVSELRDLNQEWIDAVKPKLRQAVLWMVAPENAGPAQAVDEPHADRFFLNADAVGEVGVLLHDDAMVKAARAYVRAGLGHLDPTGFAPDTGDPEAAGNAAGLLYAMNYYTLVANEDMRQQLQPKISWALTWFDGKARPEGTTNLTGIDASPLGQGRSAQDGRVARDPAAYSAAFYWSVITGEDHWAHLAQVLYDGQRAAQSADRHAAPAR